MCFFLLEVFASDTKEKAACSSKPPSPSTRSEATYEEKLEQLKALYPRHRLSRLKEALELADGEFVYASAIVAENIYDGYIFSSEEKSDSEAPSGSNLEERLESVLGGDNDGEDIPMIESSKVSKDVIDDVQCCIRLQPQVIKSLLEKHACELPNLSIG